MLQHGTKFVEFDREERLGVYFTHFDIHERFGITFDLFLSMVKSGAWEQFITERQERVKVTT